VSAHPNRGKRSSADGWIVGCRLGSREPTASLGIPVLGHELAQIDTAFEILCTDANAQEDSLKVDFFEPFDLVVHDEDERPTVVLRQGWHPDIGWGAQMATIPGIFAPDPDDLGPLFGLAWSLNEHVAKGNDPPVVAGSWIVTQDLGLVHHAYIPGIQIEKALGEARGTAGNVLALIVQPVERISDAAELRGLAAGDRFDVKSVGPTEVLAGLSSLWLDNGPLDMSYLADHDSEDIDPEEELWMTPKHVPVCSFGIFNPYGPTVSSLEIGYEVDPAGDLVMSLYFVLRHPSGPRIEYLGDAPTAEDMAELIMSSLSKVEDGVLGVGPEWMNVFAERYREAVDQGLRSWASASGNADRDWGKEGTELLDCALNPWSRMWSEWARADPPPEAASDPIGYWIDALNDWTVVLGEQLYIRSAWQRAIATLEDPDSPGWAQSATDFFLERIDQRLAGSFPTG
jgi:hypothetical protein